MSNPHARSGRNEGSITPTLPSPVEGEGYKERGHFHLNHLIFLKTSFRRCDMDGGSLTFHKGIIS